MKNPTNEVKRGWQVGVSDKYQGENGAEKYNLSIQNKTILVFLAMNWIPCM